MPDPLVVLVMRERKAAILAREEGVLQDMASRWLQIERNLKSDIDALAFEIARLSEGGQAINKAIIIRMDRMQKLLWQVRAQTGQYVQWADEAIAGWQAEYAGMGMADAVSAIEAVMQEYQIVSQFDHLNIDAVESMIGLSGDGAPLTKYLQSIHPAAADGIIDSLVEGIARGIHPTKIAENMANGFGMGLQQAMNTARTEIFRAYRNASLMQYDASGLVVGYKRMSARDERVCAGCLFTDGMFIDALSYFDEHNQGRCTMVPVLKDGAEPDWESPYDWFNHQNSSTQETILGTERYKAWKNGTPLEDMVTKTQNPIWGGAYVPTPVKNLK